MNLNKAIIVGRLTRDPELRNTPSGAAVCSFGVATNRIWTKRETNERQKSVEYHNVVAWRQLADIASQYLRKGSLVLVEGRLQTRNWETSSGEKRQTTEIVAERLQLPPKSMSPATDSVDVSIPGPKRNKPETKDDIPVIEEDDEEELPADEKDDNGEEKEDSEEEIDIDQIPF